MQAVVEALRTVRTSDFDEAIAAMRETFGAVELRRTDDDPVDLTMRSVQLDDLTSVRWSLRGVEGGSRGDDAPEPVLLTGLALGGDNRLWSRWEDVDLTRPFLYPEPADAELHRPDVANLAVTRTVVQERARAVTGQDDFTVRFTGTAPLTRAMDRVWRDTMAYTARTAETLVEEPDGAIASAELVDLVATLMLRVFPNTTLDAENHRDVLGPRGAALRRALRYMDEHLSEAMSIADVAEAARLSPRGLYAAFRRDLHPTPRAYLRGLRLTAVRDELRTADPGATTVEAVALRWGFADSVRFAQRYAQRFDENPAATLAR
ncbi:helix-turn-helix domain-containing protein [Amnibacterium sp.]|uniref:helix-turn-helix domain-containing protein n=1 Tax=Amnibacterium sp. TaxID=1872496 RepID=UPI003F7BB2A7